MNIVAQFPARIIESPPTESNALLASIEASQLARLKHLVAVEAGGPTAIKIELALCKQDIFYWFRWYAWTYDPRNALEIPPLPTWLPFDLFPRQVELIRWFLARMERREDGCLKKSRDIGFTWIAAAFAWWHWRFRPDFKIAFCSNLSILVDQLGNPDTIFEKMRLLYKSQPHWMLPVGFKPDEHDKCLLMINPENGAVVRGEGGDEAGRGGRSSMYFIDEAARIEHAERVDAATAGNTEVRIWGSSINPKNENNLFQRKYTSFPPERVFRFHYSDDPRKTKEWAEKKHATVGDEVWAAEYEIDDSYSVEDICIPASWVESSRKLRGLLAANNITLEPKREGIAGGDVGGGKANSVVIARFGTIVAKPRSWLDPDTIDTAFKMLDYCSELKLEPRIDQYIPKITVLRFDSIAIGQGVSATLRRNHRPGLIVVGVNVGESATDERWPDGEEANEKFFNLKAESWWKARECFRRTHEMVTFLENRGGHKHAIDELISLPDEPNDPQCQRLYQQLSQVKWNRNEKGKVIIESKASLAKRQIPSPDFADALILTFAGYSKAEKYAALAKVRL